MRMLQSTVDEDISSMIDMTAVILMNMKNDTSPVSSPVVTPQPSSPVQATTNGDAGPCDCMLCTRGSPVILNKCHTWAWIMRVVFYSLRARFPEKKFFSLKNDVYEYMMNHWNALGLDRKPSANWHKQIQDMLSHSRNIFESGMTHYKQNGFWRLRDLEDPWTASPDSPRPPCATPTSPTTTGGSGSPASVSPLSLSALAAPASPRKRGWKVASSSDSDESEDTGSAQISPKRARSPAGSPKAPSPSTPTDTPSSPSYGKSFALERDVALLREQLQHMTEGVAHLTTDPVLTTSVGSSSPLSSFANYNKRAWDTGYVMQQLGSAQA